MKITAVPRSKTRLDKSGGRGDGVISFGIDHIGLLGMMATGGGVGLVSQPQRTEEDQEKCNPEKMLSADVLTAEIIAA